MRQSFDRGLIVAAGLMAVLLTVDAWINFHNVRRLSNDELLVAHTHQVLENSTLLLQSIIDAETGYRGFLVTHDETFLQPYLDAREKILKRADRVRQLTQDNPGQQSRVLKLNRRAEELLSLYQRGIEEHRDGAALPELQKELQETRQQVTEIRELVAAIRTEEHRLLDERVTMAAKAYRFSWISGFVTLSLSLALFLLVLWLMRLNLSARERAAKQLNEEREWLRVTLASIGDGVIATDTAGRVTFLNGIAETLTGWNQEAAANRPLQEVFHIINETTREPAENPVHRTLAEGVIVGLANHTVLISRDGNECAIADSSAPIRNREHEIVGTILVFRDVAAEREEEKAQAERIRLVTLRSDVSTALASHEDETTVLQTCCQAIVKHLGVAVARVWTLNESENVLELQTSEGEYSLEESTQGRVPVGESKIGRIAASREPLLTNDVQHDSHISNQDWARRVGMEAFAGFPLIVDDRLGGVLALYARRPLSEVVMTDLAPIADIIGLWLDRRKVVRSVKAAEEQFRTLANTIPHLAWMAESNGDISWYNQRWYDYTGTTFEEMCGWGWQSVHDPEHVARVVETVRHSFESGEPWEEIFPLRSRDGEYRWHLSRMVPIYDDQGRIVRWFGTNTDITDQREAARKMRESEANLRRVIDSMFAFVGILTPEGLLIEANRAPLEMGGVTRDEVLHKHLWETYWWSDDPQAPERLSAAFDRALQGKVVRYDERVRTRDGSHIIVDFMLQPVYEDGKLIFVIPSGVDITDRKRVEDELAASREFLRASIDALSSHVAVLSDSGEILAVNAAWRNFVATHQLDESIHGVGGNYLKQLSSGHEQPEQFQEALENIRKVIAGDQDSYDIEYPAQSGGEQHWFQMRVNRFQGVGPAQVVIARQDITERILLEQTRERRTTQLTSLAGIATQLNASHEPGSILEIVARGARLIVGSQQALARRIIDRNWSQSISSLSCSESPAGDQSHVPHRPRRSLELFLCEQNSPMRVTEQDIDSHPAWPHADDAEDAEVSATSNGEWLSAPLTTFDGRNLGIVLLSDKNEGTFTHDDELTVVQLAQMASVALENSRLYEDLRAADRRKDQFLATLAHELRNPLSPLTAAAHLLDEEPENSAQVRELTEVISRQCEQLKRLIDDLLDISRISTGKLHLQSETVNLQEAISAALDISRPLVDDFQHELLIRLPDEPVLVRGDRVRLSQVVANLLINAAKYTGPGGRISLDLRTKDHRAILTIEDNGIGIPPDMLKTIFELFAQVDSSHTRSQGGLGIGLTLVKTLVDLHGGQIDASSPGLGQGSTFQVSLPCEQVSSIEASQAPRTKADSASLPNLRVLVVDDNHAASYLLARLLTRLNQECRVAETPMQALDLLSEFDPDVVISDVAMPEMSGYELAGRIREKTSVGKPWLVALTGYGQASDRQDALSAGFDEHLVKPIGLPALKTLLLSLAGRC